MRVANICWHEPNGNEFPIQPGDEIEVSYPDIRPIPHRGIIKCILTPSEDGIEIVHNSKKDGVCVVSYREFAQEHQRPVLKERNSVLLFARQR